MRTETIKLYYPKNSRECKRIAKEEHVRCNDCHYKNVHHCPGLYSVKERREFKELAE